uniref:Titin-like n=1 Tax=Saccoglossus kowalevskii TaxID=10224 RepID=A0ABM0LZ74_SACKO|nr:PREDICTED: titin-like [Saccoglossus kowalevskii]
MTDEAAVLAKINPSSVPAQNTYRDPTSPTWVQTSSPSPPAPPPKTHNDTNYSVTPVTINSTSTSKPGVWSPGAPPPRIPSGYNSPQRDANFNVAPVWKPGMSGDQVDKKEFKPVKVELNDKSKTEKRMQDLPAPPPPAESFAWKPPPPPPKDETTHEYKNLSESNSLPNRAFSHRNYTNGPTPSGLPSTQSPTVTILQHNRGVEESPPRPPPPPSHYGGGLLYAPTLSSQQASDNPNVATNTQNQAPLTSPPYKPVTSQQHYNQPSVCPPEQVRSPPPPQEKQLSPPPPPPQPSPPLLPQGQYHASPTQQRLQQQIYHKANPQQVVTSQQERQPVEKWQLNPPQQPTPPKQYQANPSQQQGPPQQYQDSSSQQQRPPPLQSYQASPQQQERPPPPQQYQTSPQQQQRPPPPPPPQHYQASPQQQERPPPPQQYQASPQQQQRPPPPQQYQASPQQQQRPPPPQQYQAFPQQQRPPPPQQYQAVSSQQQGPPPPQQYQAFPQQQQRPPPPQQYQVGPPQQQGPPPPQQYQASSYQQERPPLPQSWQSTQPQQEIPPPPPPPQQWQPDSSQQRPLPPPPPPTHQEPHHPISPPSQQQQQQRLPQPQTWQTSKQPLRVDVQSPYNAQPPHRKSIPSPTIPPRPSPPKVEMKSPPVKLNIASKDGWRPVEDMAKIADTNVFVLTDPDHHVKASIKTHDIEGSTVLKDKVIYDEPNFQVISDPQQLPPGAVYQTKTVEGDLVHTDTYYPVKVPGTVETGRRMVRQTATYDGIGPVDNESGMPIGLRTGVKEENRHDWYKEMYKSIHRQEKKDDEDNKYERFLRDGILIDDNPYTPTYIFPEDSDDKKKKETNPYTPTYQFPDGTPEQHKEDIFSYRPTYEFSDVSKRKTETEKERELSPTRKAAVGSGQQWTVPSARNTIERYQQQPRSITEYEPGKSSLAAKDKSVTGHMYNPPAEPIKSSTTYKTLPANYKRSVEPVQHQQQQQQQQLSPQHRQLSPHHQQGSPVHYHHSPPPVSHDLYKEVQKGGDIPVHGLVKKPGEEEEEDKSRSYKPASSMTAIDQVNGKQNVKAPASNRYSASDLYNYRSPAGPVSPSSNRDKQLKANAKAIYPFNPQNAKELPFKKGDMIKLIRQIDKNWYEGEHHGRVGIFPVSYVEIMSPEPVKSPIQQPQVDVSTEGKARAKYNFSGETNMELSFKKGDQITLIRRVDNNWAEGRLGNRRGIFPVSYIEVTKEPVSPAQKSPSSQPQQRQKQQHSPVKQKPKEQIYQQQRSQPVQSSPSVSHQYYQQRDMPPPPPTPPVQEHFRAIYPYAPQNEDELELIEGDVVVVMEKCDDGWFVGTSTRTGHFGTFPGNYVEKM